MKLDRIFIELHDDDDVVLVDVDAICAIVGHNNSTVYFFPFTEGFVVDETPREVTEIIRNAYVKAREVGGLARETTSPFDKALGYPR